MKPKRNTNGEICCVACGNVLVAPGVKYFVDPLSVPCPKCGLVNKGQKSIITKILNLIKEKI